MTIAILGAGALGSAVGGSLALAGQMVELWDVNQDHINAVNQNGLIFDGPRGREVINLRACRPDEGGDATAIILLTKTLQTEAALQGVADKIADGAMVLTAQNGLGNAARVAALVPPAQVLYGCTMMPARLLAPGHVAGQSNGRILYRAYDPSGEAAAQALALESEPFTLAYDAGGTDRIIWQKAAFNCAANSICALSRATVGKLGASHDGMSLAYAIAAEAVAVAHATGVDADKAAVLAHLDKAVATNTEHKPSMLQDIEAGRPTEIDSLCTEVARLGSAVGVPTPLNRAMAALIHLNSDYQTGEAA